MPRISSKYTHGSNNKLPPLTKAGLRLLTDIWEMEGTPLAIDSGFCTSLEWAGADDMGRYWLPDVIAHRLGTNFTESQRVKMSRSVG